MKGETISGLNAEDVKKLLKYREAFDFVADYVLSNSALPGQYRTVKNFYDCLARVFSKALEAQICEI
ncbi:MAG: hypothetical protein LVR00_02260 [Rhabdochlamydiaceae bacterium]